MNRSTIRIILQFSEISDPAILRKEAHS